MKDTKELSRKARGKGSSKTRKLQAPASHFDFPNNENADDEARVAGTGDVLGAVASGRGSKDGRGGAKKKVGADAASKARVDKPPKSPADPKALRRSERKA